ncbi:MAG: hypothetical protein ACR2RB_19550 [Gammaproteobacteria bacterium]
MPNPLRIIIGLLLLVLLIGLATCQSLYTVVYAGGGAHQQHGQTR